MTRLERELEDYSREQGLLVLLGTSWENIPPPLDLLDFLAVCWFIIEWSYLSDVRHGMRDWARPAAPKEETPRAKG